MATGNKTVKRSEGKWKKFRSSLTNSWYSLSGDINKQILVVTLLLCGAIAIIIAFASSNSSDYITSAESIGQSSCQVESPTPQDIYACYTSQCTFDVSLCSQECPFGFSQDENHCANDCSCAEKGTFEGDIMFNEEELPILIEQYGFGSSEDDFSTYSGSASIYDFALWKHNKQGDEYIVKYALDSSLDPQAIDNLKEAISRFHDKTCLRFEEVLVGSPEKHMLFRDAGRCSSPVGRRYSTPYTAVSITFHCKVHTCQHEILHALGFFHEQSRPDRDSYVEIFEENMWQRYKYNFRKKAKSAVRDVDSEYDIKSLLHYDEWAFSRNWKKTISARSGESLAGSKDFTSQDLYELNEVYKCDKSVGGSEPMIKWTPWTKWSSCDETCGTGQRARYRKCEDVRFKPVSGCKGSSVEKISCKVQSCPGVWGAWGNFYSCTKTCGDGWKYRLRRCPTSGCPGKRYEVVRCNRGSCKKSAMWTSWSNWSQCLRSCGLTVKTRNRFCQDSEGVKVVGCGGNSDNDAQGRYCRLDSCESFMKNWGPWSQCSATCEGYRKRTCTGKACSSTEEVENCATRPCKEPDIFSKTRQNLNVNKVCNAAFTTDNWVFGDFNGDGRMDIVCSDGYGVYELSYGTSSGFNNVWSGSFSKCDDGILLEGDVNGDGKSDLICNSQDEGRLFVKYSSYRSFQVDLEGGDFCTEYLSKLTTNTNTGKTSLLCHHENNRVEMVLANE